MASKEVTVDQFLRFRKEHEYSKRDAPTGDCPMNKVSWYAAAAYCNWLSEQEGIPKEQWCYLPNREGKYDDGMLMALDFLKRTGYRLPTEAEWEYACRAGSEAGYSCGESADVLSKYAWFDANSLGVSHPVGLLKPNDLGLFDMHGNDWEWCQDVHAPYAKATGNLASVDSEQSTTINAKDSRVLRSGTFIVHPSIMTSSLLIFNVPTNRSSFNGFRLARTFIP